MLSAISVTGEPPFQIYTNVNLDIWLVGDGFRFAEQWEHETKDGVTEFHLLTPKLLALLRRNHAGQRTAATERFARVLKEHWNDGGINDAG